MLIQRHKLSMVGPPILRKHLLTHRRLHVCFFHFQATIPFIQESASWLEQAGVRAFTVAQTQALPQPLLINNFLKERFYS